MDKLNRITISFSIILISVVAFACTKPKLEYSDSLKPKITITGTGNRTILLEAGLGNWSLFYTRLSALLSAKYKVIVVDRAGYNMKSASFNQRDVETITKELHNALADNGINDSLILVGHSFGGLIIREYQALFPGKIKGLVLLESAHPDQFQKLPFNFKELNDQQITGLEKLVKVAQRGLLKTKSGKKQIPTFGLPEDLLPDYYSVTTNAPYYATLLNEQKNFETSLNRAKAHSSIGALPLLVLASENSLDESIMKGADNYPYAEHNQKWLALQHDLELISTNSLFYSTPNSNHYLHLNQAQWVYDKIDYFITTKIY